MTSEEQSAAKKGILAPFREIQISLLQKALANWPRRGTPLLEVNCGKGDFLPLFWRSGFEIIATEKDQCLRKIAASKPVPGLEIYAASDDYLPFDNDYFDWVVVHLFKTTPDQEKITIAESLRVARRGIMVSFWNTSSLAAKFGLFAQKEPFKDGFSWLHIWRVLYSLKAGPLSSFSSGFAPQTFWHNKKILAMFEHCAFFKFLGAWCLMRVDIASRDLSTPLPLKLKREMTPQSPVFEYSHKIIKKVRKGL